MQTYIPNICSQICGKSIDIQTDILYNQCKQLFGNYVRNLRSEYAFETEVPHMYTFEEVNAMLNEDTYYLRSISKRRARQKQVRHNILLLVISVLFIFVSVFFVASISTQASDKEHMPSYKYFRSIEISSGDTLWSIAEDNMDARYYRHTADYVAEVKRMNSLDTDQIIAGSYLIIPYYSTEFVGSTD